MLKHVLILALAVVLIASPGLVTASGKGGGPGGGGGGGGGGSATHPFVGSWAGLLGSARYDFTFTKDFLFTLVVSDDNTGEVLDAYSGMYSLGGFGKDGFPLITMFSGGEILLQEEYSGAFEGMALRGTIGIIIGRL